MPKLRAETEKARAVKLTKAYTKSGFNQTRLAEQEGVTSQNINQRLARPIVKKTLEEQIEKTAKKVGINLDWLLTKYKDGADNSTKIIGYLHQHKKDKDGEIEEAKPDEVISNDFVDPPDWNVRRLYLRDIAEILKWIKQNGHGNSTQVHVHLNVEERNARINRLTSFYQN